MCRFCHDMWGNEHFHSYRIFLESLINEDLLFCIVFLISFFLSIFSFNFCFFSFFDSYWRKWTIMIEYSSRCLPSSRTIWTYIFLWSWSWIYFFSIENYWIDCNICHMWKIKKLYQIQFSESLVYSSCGFDIIHAICHDFSVSSFVMILLHLRAIDSSSLRSRNVEKFAESIERACFESCVFIHLIEIKKVFHIPGLFSE